LSKCLKVSKKVSGVEYAIRDVVSAAKDLENEGKIIDYLNIGDPVQYGFQPPDNVKQALIDAVKNGNNYYSPSEGIPELREAIAQKENSKGLSIGKEDVLVTNGISEGLDMVISSIIEDGDEVLLPGPYYPPYASYVRLHGGIPVEFAVDLENSTPDIDDIKVEKKAGGSIPDSSIIQGIVLDKEVVHSGMPKKVTSAKIALINTALEISKTETDAKINISNPQQMKSFLDEENKMLKNMVDKVIGSGATVAFCQKGVDDMAQHYLAKAGLLVVRRVKESDLTKLAKATGGNIVTNLDDLFEKDLGTSDIVEERKIEEDRWVFVEGCKHPKSVTLLLRAGSQRVVDEVERSVHDAIMVVRDIMELPSIVAGGGAPETYAATKIRSWAKSLEGREQLAAEKFAEALEAIPLSLSENAGMDPIDTLTTLRSRQLRGHKWTGIDVMKGKVADMKSSDIIEPLLVKNQIISSAAEAACMILRIDDVIATAKSAGPPPGAEGGMPPGMGGMGGMPPGMGGMM